ncbi:MAG: hypothetical protein Q8M71_01010 [Thermodesulfovibrionales bacterium]|nr:hypothetical protein [Thermodesulfovibrionales bacterium]
MAKSFEEIDVWKKARELGLRVWSLILLFSKRAEEFLIEVNEDNRGK